MSEKIYDSIFSTSPECLEACGDFVAIVRQLRRDCLWDRQQTHISVKHLLIEEAYEALEAIESENWEECKKELGDVLLQVVFHAVMAEEAGHFNLREVVKEEMDKLVRRHPHVFGNVEIDSVEEVLSNWENIKRTKEQKESVLEGLPIQLPALLSAYRIQEKVAGVGFDFPTVRDAWGKVEEEIREVREVIECTDIPEKREEEFGDLLFALVNYARFAGINPENALRKTNQKFTRRFQYVEKHLKEQNQSLDKTSLEEMDRYWEEAKNL